MVRQAIDLVTHKLRLNTHWEDYYRFGFYRRDMPWSEKELYLSDHGSYYWHWEGNSLKFDRLFIRKSMQNSVLAAEGIRTPQMFFKAGTDCAVNNAEALGAELAKIDVPFLTKFDGGGGGARNLAFEPEEGGFRSNDEIVDAEWIWRQYEGVGDTGFLVEERVRNHEDIARIYPLSLNTLRLNLVKTADGKWHQLMPMIKFGRGGSHVDNSSAGGLSAAVDHDGRIGRVFNNEQVEFDGHPDTGEEISGQVVPYFEEARELALRACKVFGFMATIGWDVGITPEGPTIIEGNPAWHSRNYQDALGPFLTREIAAGLSPRKAWTPWDKTRMSPGYMDHADGGWRQRYLSARRKRLRLKALERLQQASRQ